MDYFFVHAFELEFGKRRGVNREARSAYARFKDKGSLSARARRAVTSFLSGFGGSPAVSTT